MFDQIIKALNYRNCRVFTAYPPEKHEAYRRYLDAFYLTSTHRDIFGTGGNGSGKSFWLCTIISYMATNLYPTWWPGRRYNRNLKIAIGSTTIKKTKELLQDRLFGDAAIPGDLGFIPNDMIVGEPKKIPNGEGAWSKVVLKQANSDFHTHITFFSHAVGQMALQGNEFDVVAIDEIPEKHNVTIELFSRTRAANKTNDTMFLMVGTSLDNVPFETIKQFYLKQNKYRANFQFSTWDAPHLSQDEKERLAAQYTESELRTRMDGYPAMGEQSVFPFHRDDIITEPKEPEDHWLVKNGYDEGKYAGIVVNAYDPFAKMEYYIESRLLERYTTEQIMKQMYELNLGPWVCDTSLKKEDPNTRRPQFLRYVNRGYTILFPKNKKLKRYYLDRMRMKFMEGRLKICDTKDNQEFIVEVLMYSKDKEGNFIKQNDHRIDAAQYEQQYSHSDIGMRWDKATYRPRGILPTYMDLAPIYDDDHEIWTRDEERKSSILTEGNLTW